MLDTIAAGPNDHFSLFLQLRDVRYNKVYLYKTFVLAALWCMMQGWTDEIVF